MYKGTDSHVQPSDILQQKIIRLLVPIILVESSLVRDSYFDRNKITEEYCPKSEHCEEGTHVMCMYYNPKELMGRQCHDVKDVQIRRKEAARLMELSNAIRGNIARGKETGKDEELLPRAYGMYRLEWDEELASFAQVLANQCLLRHDLCRATKKFPEPGQTTGVYRFTYPDWYSITGNSTFPPGLSDEKLILSISHIMQSWYLQKSFITPDMILSYPNWSEHMDKVGGKLYLEMISGDATHMGCGISAYAQYAYHANNADLSYNNIQLVCNYSARPRKGKPLYNTKPPTDSDIGFTVRCGCPIGYDEDYNCLCYPSNRGLSKTCDGDRCKPSVVLLPIFTVEDAPAHKMIHSNGPENALNIQDSFEILDKFDKFNGKSRKALTLFDESLRVTEKSNFVRQTDVRRRYFEKPKNKSYGYTKSPTRVEIPARSKIRNKPSIFTRSATFVLPTRRTKIKSSMLPPLIKKDVIPRKDFSSVRNLVTTYLSRKRKNGNFDDADKNFNSTLHYHDRTTEKYTTTISSIKFNQYLNHKDYDFVNVTDKPVETYEMKEDKKVINLLDDLQAQVKHIDFDRNEKEIFDAKLRQIYSSLSKYPKERADPEFDISNVTLRRHNYKMSDQFSIRNSENEEKYSQLNRKRQYDNSFNDPIDRYNHHKDSQVTETKYKNMYGIRRKNKDLYKRPSVDEMRGNYYLKKDNDGLLSNDRRKFYQEKLDDLEKKLQRMRSNFRRKNTMSDNRHLRPVRPAVERRLEESSAFYLPDRARFLHGF